MSKVLYRYESISSELKVWAERSPLSEWTEITLVRNLRFQIIFNRSQPQVIRGNQNQLESLISGVADYVDSWLNFDTQINDQTSSQNLGIKLFHHFFIPNLQKFNRLEVSTLELFDLITNLELLTNEVEILPRLNSSLNWQIQGINSPWLKVAAAAIAAVGITTGIRLLQPPSPQYVVSSSPNQTSPEIRESLRTEPKSIKPDSSNNISLPKNNIEPSVKINESAQKAVKVNPATSNLPERSPISPPPKLESKLVPNPSEQSPQPTSGLSDSGQILQNTIISPNPSISKAPEISEQPVIPSQPNPSINSESAQIDEQTADKPKAMAPFSAGIGTNSDRLNRRNSNITEDKTSKLQKLKLEVIQINGSPNSQNLKTYKEKIEKLKISPAVASYAEAINELKIEVRWQNRQITEIKIIPETLELSELTNFMQRSLLDTFPDQDGNIEIKLKLTDL